MVMTSAYDIVKHLTIIIWLIARGLPRALFIQVGTSARPGHPDAPGREWTNPS
jgi:hypothetical protein